MRVSSDQVPGGVVEPPSTPNGHGNQRISAGSTTPSTVEEASKAADTAIVTPAQRQTDVTFRRDGNGRIYYVVADAQSGKEILEVPPESVRAVDQGIADYLKEAESKATTHIKVKA